jgi:hypothetical protein
MSTSKIERLQQARAAVTAGAYRVLFYTPDTQKVISGAVIEIYQLAATLRRQGLDAQLLVDSAAYEVPLYLDEDLQALPRVVVGDASLLMKPEDVLVIPEYFTTVIHQTAKLPCLRVVLVQGYDNMLTSMIPGTNWAQLGIKHVWTMSQPLTDFVREIYGNALHVQTLRIGIPDYFRSAAIKDPVVAVEVRNPLDLTKITNEFFVRFPHLRWVGFEPLTGRTRKAYAELMGRSAVVLWVDRVAAFGQTAVEAMACATPLVALVPDHDPEYLNENNAVWVNRFSEVATHLGNAITLSLENGLPTWLTEGMAATAAAYTPAAAEVAFLAGYAATLALRDQEQQDLINYFETQEPTAEVVA